MRISFSFTTKPAPDGAVEHQGDNRTGEGDGDDEQVKIDLICSSRYQKLVFAVTIMMWHGRKQTGMVSTASCAFTTTDNGTGNCPFRSVEEMPQLKLAMVPVNCIAGAEWKFKAVGQG